MSNIPTGEILDFWFGFQRHEDVYPEEIQRRWFEKNPDFDQEIKERFEKFLPQAENPQSPSEKLAHIILFDQFPRNIYRGEDKAFSYDIKAHDLALRLVESQEDTKLSATERVFAYLPFEHTEDLKAQILAVELFQKLAEEYPGPRFNTYLDYAIKHHDIIARFGRFPHRNEALGRLSTEEEILFLQKPGSSF